MTGDNVFDGWFVLHSDTQNITYETLLSFLCFILTKILYNDYQVNIALNIIIYSTAREGRRSLGRHGDRQNLLSRKYLLFHASVCYFICHFGSRCYLTLHNLA